MDFHFPIKKITSLQHPIVKHLVKLRQNRDYRQEHQKTVISNNKMIKELSSLMNFSCLLIKEGFPTEGIFRADALYEVTEEILKKISGLVQPEELIAEAPLPPPSSLKNKKKIITLDGIFDPGNLGTLARSALALGWEGLFLLPDCVDPFNDKSLRASKGAVFRLAMRSGSHEELKTLIAENQLTTYIADMHGEDISQISKNQRINLILGNEAHGISKQLLPMGKKISIPMSKDTESLNVGVAGGILMYLLR